jgi:hypothetical protein
MLKGLIDLGKDGHDNDLRVLRNDGAVRGRERRRLG